MILGWVVVYIENVFKGEGFKMTPEQQKSSADKSAVRDF